MTTKALLMILPVLFQFGALSALADAGYPRVVYAFGTCRVQSGVGAAQAGLALMKTTDLSEFKSTEEVVIVQADGKSEVSSYVYEQNGNGKGVLKLADGKFVADFETSKLDDGSAVLRYTRPLGNGLTQHSYQNTAAGNISALSYDEVLDAKGKRLMSVSCEGKSISQEAYLLLEKKLSPAAK